MVQAPPTPKRRHTHTLHGISREDPYHWLRDDNWQAVMRNPEVLAPEIRAHLEAENAYTEAVMARTGELREVLFQEFRGRMQEDESSVPQRDGAWEYYQRYETGSQHPRYCRRAAGDAASEQVLFDAEAASKAHAYFHTGSVAHSRTHGTFGYGQDTTGSEFYELRFKDLARDKELDDRISHTNGSLVFSADGEHVFYIAVDANHRPHKVLRHRLGTPVTSDVLVYEDADPGFFLGIASTSDRRHIVITSHDHTTSEQWLIRSDEPEGTPRLVAARQRGREYYLHSLGDRFLILTNAEAEDFRLMEAPLEAPEPANWRELLAHEPGRLIVSVLTFAGHIARLERKGGLPRVVIRRRSDASEHTVAFAEETYSITLVPGFEYDSSTLRFVYSSFTTPDQTFDYHMDERSRRLQKQRQVPSGHDPSRYRSRRIEATSHDGEKVPISLIWHESTPIDGTAPVLLYGYGSYGRVIPVAFSGNRLSLVNRGFVFALAHIRGGMDNGYAWYRRGRALEKKNTFFDFVAAADHLCAAGYTSPGNITIHGGSAGGMLVGAVVNMRPSLFKGVLAEVPFVDVLNTMCDGDLPLTPPEWPEWGNPLLDRAAYDYIASYSPYDNVTAQPYPHIMATAGLTDPRVTYWEPAKWIARLRELSTSDRLLLLKTYMEAGHAGAAGRFDKLREVAFVYAFVLLIHERATTPQLSSEA
jgi:oligopeptidase B